LSMGMTHQFFVFVPCALTFGLDIQTHPSEGPNTFSMWIWCKSVQRFPRYLRHKQKTKVADSAKNRTLLTCGSKS